MSGVTIRNVWKEYAGQTVLERLNLHVASGEFVTIVGASGCGKTTFLRMLLGQESPTRGTILLDGQPLPAEPGPERGIVFQRYSVFPHLSALDNVTLALELPASPVLGRLFAREKRIARDKAAAMLRAVGLEHAFDRYPSELSGGMQQRLAIAQSLVSAPKVLLLDEPFGALDPGIRGDMQALIRQIWQQTGVTVFMITHDLPEAFALGSRVLVFDKPRIDPQAPQAYGATITYDIPLRGRPGQVPDALVQRLSSAPGAPNEEAS
ncbi:ABC transporter ATP-binding protein [Plasticicumulans acidivorans]|uniref:NitT/TauT family transport system ATP-binding protein n=1 Tax=Plasticicumulans acidivorans TaxID=886464 RepID=A0A317MZQ4_9GAMM|nr:ABC transporter ATP-binding protein [Plasticicumulans acidivorans]PWV65687.1 NitT/TauT family transport system ATP-binding protein [Plasticicumulans acidivorans]